MQHQNKPPLHRRSLTSILLSPLSTPTAAFIGNFLTVVLLRLWSMLPSSVRRFLHLRFDTFIASRTQARFKLQSSARLFSQSQIDRKVVTIDGVALSSTHLFPHLDDETKPHPVAIMRTPYFRKFDIGLGRMLCERGFHVLVQDGRGRFQSEGEASLGHDEKRDAGCTLRWLSEQPWCDGRVICIGLSIGGYTSWATAAAAAEKLYKPNAKQIKIVAVFPLFTSSTIIQRGFFHDGLQPRPSDNIMRLDLSTKYSSFMWSLLNHSHILGSPLAWVVLTIIAWQWHSNSQTFLDAQKHLPLQDVDVAVIGEEPKPRLPLIYDPRDPFWKDVDHSAIPRLVGSGQALGDGDEPPAVFFTSGWWDIFSEDTIHDFCAAQEANKLAKAQGMRGNDKLYLVMGPYTHFSMEQYLGATLNVVFQVVDDVFQDLELPAHHEHSLASRSKVMVWCLGAGGWFLHKLGALDKLFSRAWSPLNEGHHCWRHYDEWPPSEAVHCALALGPEGQLRPFGASSPVRGADSFEWDPNDPTPTWGGATFSALYAGPKENAALEARADTLVYTTPKAAESVDFAGIVNLRVWLSSSAVSADLHVRVCLVDPIDKSSTNILDGIQRFTLAEGEMWPRFVTVKVGNVCGQIYRGWRLRIIVSGGSFPQFSRNLGLGEDMATATRMVRAKHMLHFSVEGRDEVACLELPVVGGAGALHKGFAGV